jgi:hypothetical protein
MAYSNPALKVLCFEVFSIDDEWVQSEDAHYRVLITSGVSVQHLKPLMKIFKYSMLFNRERYTALSALLSLRFIPLKWSI